MFELRLFGGLYTDDEFFGDGHDDFITGYISGGRNADVVSGWEVGWVCEIGVFATVLGEPL